LACTAGYSEGRIAHLKSQPQMVIFLVEQYFGFAFGLAYQVYVMTRGKIVYLGHKSKK